MEKLEETYTSGESDVAIKTMVDKVDEEWMQFMQCAEKKCRRLKYGRIPLSPENCGTNLGKCIVKWDDTNECDVVPSAVVRYLELDSDRPRRRGTPTTLRTDADSFSVENSLEVRYTGEKITILSQTYKVIRGRTMTCKLPHIQHALYIVCQLYNASLLDSCKFEQKVLHKETADIAKRKIATIEMDMKKATSQKARKNGWRKRKEKKQRQG